MVADPASVAVVPVRARRSESLTLNVSWGSPTASFMSGTEIVFVVSPGANSSVPEVATKSEPATALPLSVT